MSRKMVINILSIIAALLVAAYIYNKPSNFAECLLSEVSGPMSSLAAEASIKVCRNNHPAGLTEDTKGIGLGLLSYSDMYECIASKAKKVDSKEGQAAIAAACRHLY